MLPAQAYLNQQIAMGDDYFDYLGTGVAGIRYIVDLRQRNAARTQINGFDLAGSYLWQRAVDTFSVSVNVTHINKLLTSLTSDSLTFDQVNRYNEPLSWPRAGARHLGARRPELESDPQLFQRVPQR